MSEQFKEYIGDGVYASFDGYQIWLRTSDGIRDTNEIALEPNVWAALVSYQAHIAAVNAKYHGDVDEDGELA